MRKVLFIVLTVELLVAVVCGQAGYLHRHNLDRAFVAWHQHPTPESRMELDRQKRLNELYRWGFSAVAFGGMAALTLLGAYGYRRRHSSSPIFPS